MHMYVHTYTHTYMCIYMGVHIERLCVHTHTCESVYIAPTPTNTGYKPVRYFTLWVLYAVVTQWKVFVHLNRFVCTSSNTNKQLLNYNVIIALKR